jgi:hypothetical protein
LNRINADVHDKEPKEWSCDTPPSQTVAGHEMKDHVHKLRLVAVSRIRDYFLGQIALLRRPQTNVRMIQVHGLLKYADLQDFLDEASPEVAIEIYNVYVESMGKVRILRHHVTRCSFRRTHRNAWIPDFVCSLSNISSAATTTGFHENCHHSP